MVVHVIPIGLDSPDRYIAGLQKFPPSKIYFILSTFQDEEEKFAGEIKNKVNKEIPSWVETIKERVPILDFSNVMTKFVDIIADNKDSKVYINVSSSTKIVCQAAYMAAALFDAHIYYVPANRYLSSEILTALRSKTPDRETSKLIDKWIKDGGVYLSTGAKPPIEIPILKMKKPKKEKLEILEALKNSEEGFSSIKRLMIDGLKRDYNNNSDRNKYSNLIRELEKEGFVRTKISGRKKGVKSTESGEVIAKLIPSFQKMKKQKW